MYTKEELLYRTWRLIQYKRFYYPILNEFDVNFEYEYATSVIFNTPHWKYGKWGSPWGFAHKEHLKEALQKYDVRARIPLTTKYLSELLRKYPLEFKYNGMTIIVTPQPNREVFINGHPQTKLPQSLDENWFYKCDKQFSKDWKCLILADAKLSQPTLVWELQPQNILYKYFNNIVVNLSDRVKQLKKTQNLDEETYQILKSKKMTTKELRDLLKETPLNFEFEGMDLLVLPKKKDGYDTHEVYVNGIEQFSIGWFEPLSQKWFCRNKNLTQARESFEKDWRCLLSLNNSGKEPQNWLNIVPKYYKGFVINSKQHIQEQLKKPNPEKTFHVRDIIRNLLAERATFNKFKNYGKHP